MRLTIVSVFLLVCCAAQRATRKGERTDRSTRGRTGGTGRSSRARRAGEFGGHCFSDGTCSGDLVCAFDTDTCQPVSNTVGTGCVATLDGGDTCGGTLICIVSGPTATSGVCSAPYTTGQKCGESTLGGASVCGDGLDCVSFGNEGSFCAQVNAIGEECNYQDPTSPTKLACGYPAYCKLEFVNGSFSGTCADDEIVYCPSSACPSGQFCLDGICRIESTGTYCNEDYQVNFQDQSFCSGGDVCLSNGIYFSCYPDECYGVCGMFTTCTNTVCKRDFDCPEQVPCCSPVKNIGDSEPLKCADFFTTCVCQRDPACCSTTLDDSSEAAWMASPGWDIQCVEEATTNCFAPCLG